LKYLLSLCNQFSVGGLFVREPEIGIDPKILNCNLEIGMGIAALTGREPSQHGGRGRLRICHYKSILYVNSGAFSMRSCLLFGPFACAVLAG
jgi:hypothetical protein